MTNDLEETIPDYGFARGDVVVLKGFPDSMYLVKRVAPLTTNPRYQALYLTQVRGFNRGWFTTRDVARLVSR